MLKLNWFCPEPPLQTGIAEYSESILPHLVKRFEVTSFTNQKEISQSIQSLLKLSQYNSKEISIKDFKFDSVNIYNIGNNIDFHSDIFEVASRIPGIVILHDSALHHFFSMYFMKQYDGYNQYISVMKKYYGRHGELDAIQYLRGGKDIDQMAKIYPLLQLVLEKALAVIVHADLAFNTVKNLCKVPVYLLDLPVKMPICSKHKNKNSEKIKLISFGYMSTNRRLESILSALSQIQNPEDFEFHIYGTLWNEKIIKDLIRRYHFENMVFVHGFTDEAILDQKILESDLGINLRNPSMGEASISQLKISSYGLPCIVSNTAWYAIIPDECITKISLDNEIDDLVRELNSFRLDRSPFLSKGQAALSWVQKNHSSESYVTSFQEIIEKKNEFQKIYNLRTQIDIIGKAIYNVEGLDVVRWQIAKSLENSL